MSEATTSPRRHRLVKRLRLGGLCAVGICTVSVPVTAALGLSATGTSDVLTLGDLPEPAIHHTPDDAVAGLRCTARAGTYALTFDGGPVAGATDRVVAALTTAGGLGTFFDRGEQAAAHPALVDLQRGVGQVANGGYTGVALTRVSQARRVQELQATAKVLGHPNVLFRAPHGAWDAATAADVERSGLTMVRATVDATEGDVAGRALSVRPGGIVALREDSDATVEAIPAIVSGLRKRGMCPGFVAADASGGHAQAVRP